MREFSRSDRLGAQIQRELAALVRDELEDRRLRMVTIQEVRVDREIAHAKVFFTLLGDVLTPEEASRKLNKAAGFLRRLLGRSLSLRVVPELHFQYDESVERGSRLTALIEEAVRSDGSKASE